MVEAARVDFMSDGLSLEGRHRKGWAPGPMKGLSPAILICHPHPLFGGSMDNSVVLAVEEACAGRGLSTLCFNFRGVGASQGRYDQMKGEVEDVVSALWFLARRPEIDSTRLALAGYSFGGLVASLATARLLNSPDKDSLPLPAALALISPMSPAGGWEANPSLETLYASSLKALVMAGTRDNYCSPNSVRGLAVQFGPQARMVILEGADHFYAGREDEAAVNVADFMEGTLLRQGLRSGI